MNTARLIQLDYEKRIIPLSGNTVLGRADFIEEEELFTFWKHRLEQVNLNYPRLSYDVLKELYLKRTLDFNLDKRHEFLSRKHVMVCAPSSFLEEYSLVDLFSSNGTMINGKYIYPGSLKKISHGSVICLPFTHLQSSEFLFEEEYVSPQALLLTSSKINAASSLLAKELNFQLKMKGFSLELFEGNLKKDRLLEKLKEKEKLSPLNEFLFMYFGDGTEHAQLSLEDTSLSTQELYGAMRGIKAKKTLLFDSCPEGNYFRNAPFDATVIVQKIVPYNHYEQRFLHTFIQLLRSSQREKNLSEILTKTSQNSNAVFMMRNTLEKYEKGYSSKEEIEYFPKIDITHLENLLGIPRGSL